MNFRSAQQINNISQRQAALIGGYGILFVYLVGIFASSPDSEKVLEVFLSSPWTFGINILVDVMMLLLQLMATLGLYVFFNPVHKRLSRLAAFFRFMHVICFGTALIAFLIVLGKINGAETIGAIDMDQLKERAPALLEVHKYSLGIGLISLGFHFIFLGYLVIKSSFVPNLIGALLFIASMAYLTTGFASMLLPNYEDFKMVLQWIMFTPAILVELLLCAWLILSGGK